MSDLLQLPMEKALSQFKMIIKYAQHYAPCLLVIDEADRLCSSNPVAQHVLALFLKFFSGGLDSKVQLFFITNYPHRLNRAINSRIAGTIFFPLPSFSTQKKSCEILLKVLK